MPKISMSSQPSTAPVPASGLVQSSGLVALSPTVAANNPNAVIPNSDFVIITKPKRKAVCLVFGDGGTGKTTFGLRFTPQPVALIGFDGRSEYVEEAMLEAGRPVPAVQLAPPSVLQKSDNVRATATEVLKKFFRNFDAAIEASRTGRIRTIVVDTGSELGEVMALAVRGTLDASASKDYGRSKDQINQLWWRMFGAARFVGQAHLVVLSRASPVWEDNEPTGDFRARINDTARDAVDFSLHIRLAPDVPVIAAATAATSSVVASGGLIQLAQVAGSAKGPRPVAKKFELVVKKAGNRIEGLGDVYRESDWGGLEGDGPFVYACTRLMPGSTPNDWK